MKMGYTTRLTLVIINALCVMMAWAHVPVTPYIAILTAQFLLVYYVVNLDRITGIVGGMLNYMGVVNAALVKLEPLWSMAIVGSLLMLWDALSDKQE